MQEGIESEEAATAARAAGLDVVMNQCMMQAHRRLIARLDTL
jgi:predicted CoA-binding protein